MSRILSDAQESAQRLRDASLIDDAGLWEVNALCAPQKRNFTAEDIKRIRAAANVSETVFAAFLGVGTATVQHWEQGLKKPNGPASKLLDLVDHKGFGVLASR